LNEAKSMESRKSFSTKASQGKEKEAAKVKEFGERKQMKRNVKSKGNRILIENRNEDFLYFDEEQERNKRKFKRPLKRLKASKEKIELFCVCRSPDDGIRSMIQCDPCTGWFHFDCVKLNPVIQFFKL